MAATAAAAAAGADAGGRAEVVPGASGTPAADTTADWPALFRAAGLPLEAFRREVPLVNPRVPADHAVGWTGVLSGESDKPFHIAAASCRGKPVYFELIAPWERNSRKEESMAAAEVAPAMILGVAFLAILVVILFLAWRALRSGRGDRRSARRVAFLLFGLQFIRGVITSDMVASIDGVGVIFNAFLVALLIGLAIYPAYLVLEPFVRRYWPHAIISWARLFSGRLRDPMVGRDVLAGCVLAGVNCLLFDVSFASAKWIGLAPPDPGGFDAMVLRGGRQAIGTLVAQPVVLLVAVGWFFLYLFTLILFKRRKLAVAVTIGVLSLSAFGFLRSLGWIGVLLQVLRVAVIVLAMVRLGMLTTLISFAVTILMQSYPVTFDFSHWYAGIGLIGFLAALSLAAWGAWRAAAGQPLFRDEPSG